MAGGVDADATAKRAGIDYSKFDSIEDSDDEKEKQTTAQAPSSNATAAEKPHCFNCHAQIAKPLRCGVCKKASYCSAKCQKDDWRFHKRTCKKPEEPKPKQSAKPASRPKEERRERPAEEKVVVDDEENFTWYRHREWKPAEDKKEFKPKQLSSEEASAAETATGSSDKATVGSVWNKAGTWEDKDVTEQAQTGLKQRLSAIPAVDAASGSLESTAEDFTVDASRPVIRGKQRHIFDCTFKVKITFRWMSSEGPATADGHVQVSEFTHDTFAEGVLSSPVMELSFSKTKLHESRFRAVEDAIGAQSWPPPEGTVMHSVAIAMKGWSDDFVQGGG